MSIKSTAIIQNEFPLPEVVGAAANYLLFSRHGNLLFLSGQLPRVGTDIKFTGKVGLDVSLDEARQAARICASRLLSVVSIAAGSLDDVDKAIELTVYVNSADTFGQQSKVADAASDFLEEVLGERGRHARAAVGVAQLPNNASVEIKGIFAVREQRPG
jgi:enamine deaminase RidA (YjgF/YER057c/UK114 family)